MSEAMTDERAAELKGCPFCGEHAAEAGGVGCLNRKCEGSRLQLPRRTWNTRPIEDALRAKVSELTRLLGEAEEAIREAPIETDGSGCFKGQANDWFDKPAVRRALGEIWGEGRGEG